MRDLLALRRLALAFTLVLLSLTLFLSALHHIETAIRRADVEANNRDIYIMRPDGSDFAPLIVGPADEQGASWPLDCLHV